ncbi:dihydrolipoyllysine-residue acetyltransferase [Pseudaminobacter arsenicus]|uniref:Acetyltransferase component of pyruvate dehydrogenase complex n=1 Tax=Borborobacter arsenicus TaxID=1851146 RepID=A0A432V2B0_9HYPH|nr:dihydrolipoyllysine-residue acetyltransferase [Pseudaminobacter arsenicus]
MSETITITLPDIGDYKDVPVVEILVKQGDSVSVDDPLLTVESDKATMEVPAPAAGAVKEIKVAVGTKVSQGSLLMLLEAASVAAQPSAAESASASALAKAVPAAPPPVALPRFTTLAGGVDIAPHAHATPSVRAFARELGVNLAVVKPSGPKGRILREDVSNHVKATLAGGASCAGPGLGNGLPAWPAIDYAKFGPVERQSLSRIQKISGGNLARNWLTIPHVTNFDKADVTGLEEFRVTLNAEKRNPDVKVTMVAFLIKASALALKAFPRFNTSLDGDELVMKKYVHVGFAADTPAGLMVPVIRDCDRKGVLEIAAEMRALADKARNGSLAATDMQGGCFSVSSLGGIGGAGFTPIINAPEVAILGAGRSAHEAVWDGKAFRPRLIMPISLSWDHRVVDGVAAARFLGHIAALLGDFRRAML